MIKVGTDFSGIGSPEAALKRLNIPHHNVFACDIDKYAKKSFLELNSPDLFYDDITTRDYKEVPQLDLYVAGFPCQSFSLAGKRGGFNDTRGTLFFNVAEFIKVNQPACFILENVKGLLSHDNGRTYQTITDVLTNGGGTLNGQMGMDTIDDGLGYHVYTKVLNTKDYGIPQNRERIFIVGFKHWRTFNFPVKLPLKLKLKDMLQDNPNSKFYLSNKRIKTLESNKRSIGFTDTNKKNIANCLIASYYKLPTDGEYIKVDDKYYLSDKMLKFLNNHKEKYKESGFGRFKPNNGNEIARCLRANAALCPTDNTVIAHSLYPRSSKTEKDKKIRRLTPLECWRLQGFTDEEFYKAQKVNSDSQLYKQAGNSITVNVMTAILKKIYLS
jgi:DNA (cytosine-5)-methyltransferase 1